METNTYAALVGFVDMLLDAICVVDAQGRFVFVSAASERIFGYLPHELIGRKMIDMVHPEDRERTLAAASEIMAGQPNVGFENRYLRKDGRVVHIMWSARWSEVDHLRIAVARDITERKRAESMRTALFRISEAAHVASDLPALFKDIHRVIGDLLPARNFFVALRDKYSGLLNFPYHVDEHDPSLTHPMAEALATEVVGTGRTMLVAPASDCHATGHAVPQHLRQMQGNDGLSWLAVPLETQHGIIGALLVRSHPDCPQYSERDKELLQFVSTQVAAAIERKQLYDRLKSMAQYDQLTQLPNRMLLQERLLQSLERAKSSKGRLALLYLDLDKFKQVNDTLGHAAGDLLLQEVAHRLKHCVRETDTVARIGGDEFVILLDRVNSAEDSRKVAEKICKTLNVPMVLKGHEWQIQPSIGIANYPENATDLTQLFRHADEAMYSAKKSGGNRFQG
ncbi:PAS domain S-box-containing protein/diguanylate cyclase (GGDEF) domain-containing protein [Pseudomonas sp. NFACC02]|uniref:sensor domain-containing protein n=1 Tax=Pseudomonas sp. NFACC02 TaxID=1566250 RepID=UPI0008D0F97A|nr:GGDEF domain-containing protein [Pseudomonas sp. NFACC02]SER28444.1 PAS domain S-box-containing protein/diguanylate cyclase (GGDEF) domain-containing protein [Pseudomonas sp. NFACC02]